MAIAYRATGFPTKVDTSSAGTSPTVAMPTGHVSGDLLIMPVFTDDNFGPSVPSGWTLLFRIAAGTSVKSPYTGWAHCAVFYRIDTGSLGSSVTLSVPNIAWPSGRPYVLAWITAYSGCDQVNPIGEWGTSVTQSSAAAQAHPQITTHLANCWLLTLRGVSSDHDRTFTNSVGTDVERFDDDLVFSASLSAALYDTNAVVSVATQTQRTTTASDIIGYGSVMASIVLRPTAVAGAATAPARSADVIATAYDATVQTQNGDWNFCGQDGLPLYDIAVDWGGDGSFSDPGDDLSQKITSDITISYGRDQTRQLNPAAVGSASFTVINSDRTFSPDFATSILFGDLEPARQTRATVSFGGHTYPLLYAKIDDYNIKADLTDRTVDFTFLDGMADLQNFNLSTAVYRSVRTGGLIDIILDAAGWTGPRDLDLGATIVPFWWVEGVDALTAINDLVKSEGPPAIAYQAPDGTFVFRDRHHRLLRTESTGVQAVFSQPTLMDCVPPVADPDDDTFDFTAPFAYQHGWRDIVNSVSFDVSERLEDSDYTPVWSQEDQVPIQNGQSLTIDISTSDPFVDAILPVTGVDYQVSGAGVLNVALSRDSGQSATLTLLAVGGAVNVSALQLRAKTISVQRNIKVGRVDADSISKHGEKSYPETAPWANKNDADAIAGMILLMYAKRRPTVALRVVSSDPAHYIQVLTRTVSDRIHITFGEMGLDDDFLVESVTHTLQRFNASGRPPVHSVILGCEKDIEGVANPFTFDLRGAGFDDGVFDPIQADRPDTVFIFDHPDQGRFDAGKYGT